MGWGWGIGGVLIVCGCVCVYMSACEREIRMIGGAF